MYRHIRRTCTCSHWTSRQCEWFQDTDTDADTITSHVYTTLHYQHSNSRNTPYEAVSSGSVVHTKQCDEHVQKARNERDIALHTAILYCNRIEKLVTEKELQNHLEAKVEHTRFWHNYSVEGRFRSGRRVHTALLKNEISKSNTWLIII